MKTIELLVDKIDEELNDAKGYIKKALEYKERDKALADMFYRLSSDEMTHMDMLHKQVVEIIMDYKRKNGEPPAAMEALYEYLHKRHVAKAAEVTNMQNMYKS